MKLITAISLVLLLPCMVLGQEANEDLSKGNEAYKKQEYNKAATYYQKALAKAPANRIASFNLGNTLLKDNKQDEAIQQFETSANAGKSNAEKGDALYNKGVVLTRQKKLDESIDAYKSVLRLNPADTLARQNLQRALNEKQQQQKNQNKDQQQKKQPNKMNKQQVQQMLNALQEQEKQLQQRMQKSKVPAPGQPDKDW